jgi:two-component system, chemotaxis family, CheB/CheR fusion protein
MSSTSSPAHAARSELPFPIVGMGASAGGLAALISFFESIPASSGMAFVVVLHLSPKHESNAAAILQRATRMPVAQITQDQHIQPDHVYVIPPDRALQMVDGHLRLGPAQRVKGGHVLIDVFFRTLAQAHQERAIAIVLSGTGADGAVGIGEVKEQGGVVFAQHPQDAEYADMPASAIDTGRVDIVLPVAEMGQRLMDLWRNAQAIELPKAPDDDLPVREPRSPEAAERALARVMGLLHSGTGHDFKHYKRATVLRRIERRLQINGLPHLPAYADFLAKHAEEVPRLLADMLIGVTNFFRDREAFEALERQAVPELFDDALQGEPLRVWVPGCSTGEEAYSLAMLMTEGAATAAHGRPIQVFATDIDEAAIARGREGLYPESIITDIAPAILRRYFTKEGLHYRVAKPLRDRVLFATHNLLRDPPFSRVDLISCRNLLIYLEREVQAEILQMFHFALRPGGFLFLGSSETAEAASKLFTVVDKKNRIYRANSAVRATRMLPRFPLGSQPMAAFAAPVRGVTARQAQPIGELHNRLLLDHAPPSVVVNEEGDILHIAGAEQYLRFPTGVPSQHLLSVIQPELRPALRAAMFDAEQNREAAQATTGITGDDGKLYQVTVTVRPVQHPDWPRELRLVLFQRVESKASLPPAEPGQRDPLIAHLEDELQRKDQQLQRSIEQYEISVEDLKASNEELQAINEELRSATEELETSKEELQSTNEELITVNHELKAKVEETAETNDDLRNLIASTGIATIFLERDLRIKRFTPQATELFNIIGSDVGRSLMDITHKLDYDRLAEDAAEAFKSLRVVEREVGSQDGRTFLARMLPYRTAEDRIDGAVLSLVDITALRDAQRSVHIDQERMQLIAQSMPGFAIMTMDEAGPLHELERGRPGAVRLRGARGPRPGQRADLHARGPRRRHPAAGDAAGPPERPRQRRALAPAARRQPRLRQRHHGADAPGPAAGLRQDRPRHDGLQAGREQPHRHGGLGAGPRRARAGRQRPQGRDAGHHLARAQAPAEPHPDQHADVAGHARGAAAAARAQGAAHHPGQRQVAGTHHRRPARPVAHARRQARAGAGLGVPEGSPRDLLRLGRRAGRAQGRRLPARRRRGRAARGRRPDAAAPGRHEPAEQRAQVHGRRRQHLGAPGAGG